MSEENTKGAEQDATLVKRSKQLFDESVAELDGATLSTLNQRRQAAIAAATARPATMWLRWLPAAGVATAAVLAVVMFQVPETNIDTGSFEAMTEFEILLDDTEFDMIEELEFYSWLELADADDLDSVG